MFTLPQRSRRVFLSDVGMELTGFALGSLLYLPGLDLRRLEILGRKQLVVDHGRPIQEIIA